MLEKKYGRPMHRGLPAAAALFCHRKFPHFGRMTQAAR
jgi:hypothetical protein